MGNVGYRFIAPVEERVDSSEGAIAPVAPGESEAALEVRVPCQEGSAPHIFQMQDRRCISVLMHERRSIASICCL
jgi:hypothetical protein